MQERLWSRVWFRLRVGCGVRFEFGVGCRVGCDVVRGVGLEDTGHKSHPLMLFERTQNSLDVSAFTCSCY